MDHYLLHNNEIVFYIQLDRKLLGIWRHIAPLLPRVTSMAMGIAGSMQI